MHAVTKVQTWILALMISSGVSAAEGEPSNWQSNWALAPGYFLEVDTSGYRLPVSIAMVPNPGSAPESPLYYVSELGGRILVVRNDRKVETFAEGFFDLKMDAEMPQLAGVIGLTGLCLDTDTGYIFAGYVYDAPEGRFNGMTRFSTSPGEFSLRPSDVFHIREPFKLGDSDFTRFPSGHQIGGCQIIGDHLYVGIGEGELTYRSRSMHSSFGKILRMTFDGSPVAWDDQQQGAGEALTVEDYVYASGLRNPFGQTLMGDNIVVADNGPGVDRVLMVREGKDYLYDGSDASIATNAMVVYSPAKGTANIVFYPDDRPGQIDALTNNLLVVLSGIPETYIEDEPSEISAFDVEPDTGLLTTRPRTIVRYVGGKLQVLSSLSIGEDGLYFAPVYGENGLPGDSNVYRLTWAPEKKYANSLRNHSNARFIIRKYGCQGCHTVSGLGGNVGPALDPTEIRARNLARLQTPEYEALLASLNAQDSSGKTSAGRNRILSLQGEKRLTAWLEEKIKEPTIDSAHSLMPLLNVSDKEARTLARFLLKKNKKKGPPKPKAAPAA